MSKLSPEELQRRLQDVKLLSLDVDGVLTDGGLYYDSDGGQLRKFNVKDGMGMVRLQEAGVHIAIISAGKSACVLKRGEDLSVRFVRIGVEDKREELEEICSELGIDLNVAAHVGDDLNDIPVLKAVGMPMSVADGMREVRDLAVFVSEKSGGAGAVRQICDLIVAAKGAKG